MGAIRPGSGGGGGGAAVPSGAAGDLVTLDGAGGLAADAPADVVAAVATVDPGIPSSGLVVDWRASALALSDGAAVGSWAPSTGVGTLTAAGGARPTYRATGNPAGGPAVEFLASSSNALTVAGVAGLPTGANPGTVLAIVSRLRPVGGTGLQHLWQYGQTAGLRARGMVVTNVDNIRSHLWSGGITETRSPRGQGLRVIAHSYDGTRESLFVDGVDYASADVALTTGTSEGVAVGSNLTAGEFGNFFLVRLFGYSRVLTAAEWRQIMDHARVAYGVQ